MDFTEIGNLGFCAIVAWWSLQTLRDSNKKHNEEVLAISKSLDGNTKAIERLCDRFDRLDGGNDADK